MLVEVLESTELAEGTLSLDCGPSHFDQFNCESVIKLPVRRPNYRSPFRYPGGKNWLVSYVEHWLATKRERPTAFIEPFAGGGSVSLAVACAGLVESVVMVELD